MLAVLYRAHTRHVYVTQHSMYVAGNGAQRAGVSRSHGDAVRLAVSVSASVALLLLLPSCRAW